MPSSEQWKECNRLVAFSNNFSYKKSLIFRNDGGLIAYGSHNLIFVVDVMQYKRIQSIEHHQSAINIVSFHVNLINEI